MNGTTNPNYVVYMALHLCQQTLDEVPFKNRSKESNDLYNDMEDEKSRLWGTLTNEEKEAVKKYNSESKLS